MRESFNHLINTFCNIPVMSDLILSLCAIFSGDRPPYVARVGSAPNTMSRRTISTLSFSTASWIGLKITCRHLVLHIYAWNIHTFNTEFYCKLDTERSKSCFGYLMPSCDAQLTLAPRDSNKRAISRFPLTQHSCRGV